MKTTVMVRYKTAPAHSEANADSVRAVFAELKTKSPSGLRYATYRLEDGVSFVHIATVTTTDGTGDNPLTSLPAFKAFQSHLKERCVEMPVFTELSPVGEF